MRLADRVAQCHSPFLVVNEKNGSVCHLSGAADYSKEIEACATRFVLSDELTRLCTALSYSKGASMRACADFLRVPSNRIWIEWAEAPWRRELVSYGMRISGDTASTGRRGVYIQTDSQGRQGWLRTFWTNGATESDVLASSMEACFDFDDLADDEPSEAGCPWAGHIRVADNAAGDADILRRCFAFRFERSWQNYYAQAQLTALQSMAVKRHALGTIAIDVPVLLAFLLLLASRPGLPRRPLMLERLNKVRSRSGKAALLDQIEVMAPVLPHCTGGRASGTGVLRRSPRLHRVRGHLVRRGRQLFWRVPHLRGSAPAGSVKTRTVTWVLEHDVRSRDTGGHDA